MKIYVLLFFGICCSINLSAQYTGGSGDGYASVSLEDVWLGSEEANGVKIANNTWTGTASLAILIPLNSTNKRVAISLYNILGQVVYNQDNISNNVVQIPPLNLPQAMYILEIQGWKEDSVFEKIVVQ